MLEKLLQYEMDNRNPADGRRVIRDERMRLMAAMATAKNFPSPEAEERVREAAREAARVLKMWQ